MIANLIVGGVSRHSSSIDPGAFFRDFLMFAYFSDPFSF